MVPHRAGHGLLLPNHCRIVHGAGAAIKRPFETLPVVMQELDPGGGRPFVGQFGLIPFHHGFRLPRHVHIGTSSTGRRVLLPERILVVGGVALVELNGQVMLVAPGTLVDIPPGVPHTWTACPPGVRLPDGTRSDGSFLMIYHYAEITGFFPTASTVPIDDVAEYRPHEGDIEAIRFPEIDARRVVAGVSFVWDRDIRSDLMLAD